MKLLGGIVCRVLGHRRIWKCTGVNVWWADRGIRYGYKGFHYCPRCGHIHETARV